MIDLPLTDPSAWSRPRRAARVSAAVALALALIQGALLATTAWDKADTFDEPFYLSVRWS